LRRKERTMRSKHFLCCVVFFSSSASIAFSLSSEAPTPPQTSTLGKSRRQILQSSGTVVSKSVIATGFGAVFPSAATCAEPSTTTKGSLNNPSNTGLASKLAKRDPALLRNSVFNVPPAAQVYPSFMRGSWDVSCQFNGYIFPSNKIPKSKLMGDFSVPGFQKCSIASIADIGKEGSAQYKMNIDVNTGLHDRSNGDLASQIDAYLGYKAVANVIHDPKTNPNRLSIVFVEYKTRNAERIELFCNARESELYEQEQQQQADIAYGTTTTTTTTTPIFVCSEYIRQVTFGGGPDVGVARQVVGNYAHFTTWKKVDENRLKGNILTAAYLDPQDSLFFDEPSKPVAIYSHVLTATRV